jgi:hypothetical protein
VLEFFQIFEKAKNLDKNVCIMATIDIENIDAIFISI